MEGEMEAERRTVEEEEEASSIIESVAHTTPPPSFRCSWSMVHASYGGRVPSGGSRLWELVTRTDESRSLTTSNEPRFVIQRRPSLRLRRFVTDILSPRTPLPQRQLVKLLPSENHWRPCGRLASLDPLPSPPSSRGNSMWRRGWERAMGKGVRFRFDREVVTKDGRDDSFVRHRSIRTCHRGGKGGE